MFENGNFISIEEDWNPITLDRMFLSSFLGIALGHGISFENMNNKLKSGINVEMSLDRAEDYWRTEGKSKWSLSFGNYVDFLKWRGFKII
jgi:hypothetical protein